jgi:hypothetical protein
MALLIHLALKIGGVQLHLRIHKIVNGWNVPDRKNGVFSMDKIPYKRRCLKIRHFSIPLCSKI